jgi:hypothetical protein
MKKDLATCHKCSIHFQQFISNNDVDLGFGRGIKADSPDKCRRAQEDYKLLGVKYQRLGAHSDGLSLEKSQEFLSFPSGTDVKCNLARQSTFLQLQRAYSARSCQGALNTYRRSGTCKTSIHTIHLSYILFSESITDTRSNYLTASPLFDPVHIGTHACFLCSLSFSANSRGCKFMTSLKYSGAISPSH